MSDGNKRGKSVARGQGRDAVCMAAKDKRREAEGVEKKRGKKM